MKASEVLKIYQAGERNFQRVNLRGQSFKGKDLSGADFSEADIRSTNFTDANLRGAKFCGAKCGLQRCRATLLVILSCLLAGILGFFSIFASSLVFLLFDDATIQNQMVGWVGSILLVIFWIFVIRRGIGAVAVAGSVAFTFAIAVAIAVAIAELEEGAVGVAGNVVFAFAIAFAVAVAGAGTVAFTFAVAVAVAFAVAVELAFAVAVAGAGTVVAGAGTVKAVELAIAFAVAVAGAVVGAYVGWRALKGDKRDAWIRSFAIAIAATGGTSFRGADLTEANFTGARLKSTDLRKANLTRVCFYGTKMLDRVRPGETYLKETPVRQWLIGKGIDKNFDYQDLRGVNLQGATLTDASFIGTDLSESNLSEATLTGACIQDWNINSHTNLDDVNCDYIYLKEGKKERRPSDPNRNFEPGEFAKLVEESIETVDLIFKEGIDWRAFLTIFQDLRVEYGEQNISIQSIEQKSDGAFVIRLSVPPEADRAEIESKAKQLYKTKLQVLEAQYREKLEAKDREIQIYKETSADILELAKLAASRPINVSQVQGNNMAGDREIEISGNAQVNASGSGALSLGDIYGTVANTINKLPSSSNPNKPGIKELLTQLHEAIDDPNLSQDDQEQTLEQLKVLAEAGQNPQDASMQKKAERAVGFLEVIAKGIEPATKLAKACAKILPKILAFFGL